MIKKKDWLKRLKLNIENSYIYIYFFNKAFAYIQATVVFYMQCI